MLDGLHKLLWKQQETSWLVGAVGAPAGELVPDRHYVNVTLEAMHIPYARKLSTTYYGVVRSKFSLVRKAHGRVEYYRVAAPEHLKLVDPRRAGNAKLHRFRLLGPVPYRGGDLEFEIGLFSVAAQNLALPFINLAEQVAGLFGAGQFAAVGPAAGAVKSAFSLFEHDEGSVTHDLGLYGVKPNPACGLFGVVDQAPEGCRLEDFTLSDGGVLCDAAGANVQSPYLVVRVWGTTERDDYDDIPEIAEAHESINAALREPDRERARKAFESFRHRTLVCADLLMDDAERIVAKVDAELGRVLPATATGAGAQRIQLRPVSELLSEN